MKNRLGLFLLLTLMLGLTLGCGLSGIGGKTQPEGEAPSGEEAAAPPSEAPSGEEAAEAPAGEAEVEEESRQLAHFAPPRAHYDALAAQWRLVR